MSIGSSSETTEQHAVSRPKHRAAHGSPRRAISLLAWRASTWLLIGWTLTMGLWIVAEISPLDAWPIGQGTHGRDQAPVITGAATVAGWTAVWLAWIAALLLLCWRDRRDARIGTAAAVRRSRWRVVIPASLAGVLAGAHFLLLAPMISNPFCASPVRINRFMSYALNCDSILFQRLAHDPNLMLNRATVMASGPGGSPYARQSRPGYIALSALSTKLFGHVASSLGLDRAYTQTDTAYIPLILINLVVVIAAVVLLVWLLHSFGAPAVVVVVLCSLLVVNDLTKAFFWTPHQQMFVLLIPLATIAAGRWLILARPPWIVVAVLGLGLGLASLIYGNVIISAGVLAVILLARGWQGVLQAATLVVTFVAALLAWAWACRKISGIYYNQETAHYHEFVWLPQSLSQGWHALASRLEMASVVTMRELLGADGLVLGLIAVSMVAAIWAGVRLDAVTREDKALLVATGLTIAFSLAFGWGIGIIATRVMFDMFPALLVLAGWTVTRFAVKSRVTLFVASYGLIILAVANAMHEVLSHGPYS